ncbi:hypothetical protein HPB50_015377 [Hyalomma asiaticum]|uniref:Uncharacterized protein n=1 Tax=Hyalomma asiaticum TaxID=266040 RepID=A0ACB7T8R3_HYAAI|nr:hypothetical protein HPB50_015377 [Hyalomma asiaticum]
MTSSESTVVPPQTQNQITSQQQHQAAMAEQQQSSSQQQQTTNHQQQSTDRPHNTAAPTKGYRNRVAVTRSISLLNYTSSGHRIDYRRHRPISQLA